MNRKYFSRLLKDVPNYSRFLRVNEIEDCAKKFKRYPSVEERTIGKTAENRPLKMYSMGEGEKTALIIGVPHSDEPLGSLVTIYFADWMATHPEAEFFEWRWLIIPVLEQRGMRMNEAWFNKIDSLIDTAKTYFREPTENQYEWTFPFEYKGYEWVHARPESIAVREICKNEKPDLLCNLHHCGFYDTYFYFSRNLPKAYPRLRRLAKNLELPLSKITPDVPFGKRLAPGFFQMYGVKDYIDYYTRYEPDNLLIMKRGASSDEWYQEMIGGFSFNCEVPLFKSSMNRNEEKSNQMLRELLEIRKKKRWAAIEYCIEALTKLEPFFCFSDPVLLGSVLKHIADAKLALDYAKPQISSIGDRKASNFEVFENDLMVDIADLLLLGQIWRVTNELQKKQRKNQIDTLSEKTNRKMMALAKKIQIQGGFTPIPLKKLVKMQIGSILIIADILSNDRTRSKLRS